MKAALYVRVSTQDRNLDNQLPDRERLAAVRQLKVGEDFAEKVFAAKGRPLSWLTELNPQETRPPTPLYHRPHSRSQAPPPLRTGNGYALWSARRRAVFATRWRSVSCVRVAVASC